MPSRGARPKPSVEARALRYLVLREHSRQELRAKLLRALHREASFDGASDAAPEGEAFDVRAAEVDVDRALDHLAAQGYLNEQRFVESRIRVRAERFGNRRIEAELQRHGLAAERAVIESTAGSERQRAHAVWARKFGGAVSPERGEQARQSRFLAARGFTATTIRDVVLRGRGSDEPDEPGHSDAAEPPDAHESARAEPKGYVGLAKGPLR